MIEAKILKQLSDRRQTTMDNIVREYLQDIFLSFLYREKKSESLLFKGGTALRLVWRSPRFSEDLDFTGSKISIAQIETLMEATLQNIESEGIKTDIEESKKTSGGYLAIFRFETNEYASGIQVEVSLRTEPKDAGTTALCTFRSIRQVIPIQIVRSFRFNSSAPERFPKSLVLSL